MDQVTKLTTLHWPAIVSSVRWREVIAFLMLPAATAAESSDDEEWCHAACDEMIQLLDGCEYESSEASSASVITACHPTAEKMQQTRRENEQQESLAIDEQATSNDCQSAGSCYGAAVFGLPGVYSMKDCIVRRVVNGDEDDTNELDRADVTQIELKLGDGTLRPLTKNDLRELAHFELVSRITFEDPILMRNFPTWSMEKSFVVDPGGRCADTGLLHQWRLGVNTGQMAPVYLMHTEEAGYGLHAKESLEPNCFVGEYTGVLRKDDLRQSTKDAYKCSYPGLMDSRPVFLTARDQGSLMRFANHSSDGANMRFVVLDGEDGWYHIVLVTLGKVEAGSQLLVDYGPQYWRDKEAPVDLRE